MCLFEKGYFEFASIIQNFLNFRQTRLKAIGLLYALHSVMSILVLRLFAFSALALTFQRFTCKHSLWILGLRMRSVA